MNGSPLLTERINTPGSTEESVLIYVFRKDKDASIPGEEIALNAGQTLYKVSFSLSVGLSYPTPFMELVRLWKEMMRSGAEPEKSTMIGSMAGASIILSLSQWCRDHGITLPSSLVIDSPVYGTDASDREVGSYLSTADSDDPYAYPLLGDYFLFPPVSLYDADGKTALLRSLLKERRIRYEYHPYSALHFHEKESLRKEYISSVSEFIRKNMH